VLHEWQFDDSLDEMRVETGIGCHIMVRASSRSRKSIRYVIVIALHTRFSGKPCG